jgi:NAD(P)-dependent dehydrogenase (short-subunit alcohol dehydrogenase family)
MASTEKGAVVVTGASTGIGRATALHLAEKGYRVFAGVRKQKDAESIEAEANGNLTPLMIDVTKAPSIADAEKKVRRAVGKDGLYGLVNNAGIADGGPIEFLPIEDFKRVVDVNLTGQVAVTQAFLPLIRRAKGRIVFITSIGGKIATPFMSPYHATKFGLEAVADSLRREVKPWGIEVIVIEPGSIATPIWGKGQDSIDANRKKAPPEAERLYGAQVKRMEEVTRETAERGIEPVKVGKTIRRALGARRPRTRYLVGTDAKVMRNAERIMSNRTFDRVMRSQMKLPDDAPPGR